MKARASALALTTALSLFACGGGSESPPLDEMPLRDALLVEPSVITQLGNTARQHLRTRFSEERLRPDATTETTPQTGAPLFDQVVAMDAARHGASRDALLSGTWISLGEKAQAVALTDTVGAAPQNPLPPLSGDLSGDTMLSEQRALEGVAGAVVERLVRANSAQRLERVVSWPIAALAAGGTVYVNASWLVAMDAHGTGCGSGGSNSGGAGPAGATGAQGQPGSAYMYLVGGEAAQSGEAGTTATDSDGKSAVDNSANASGFDLCSSSSCNSACNNTTNSCNSTSSSCTYCNDPTGDKACCRACAMTAATPQPPLVAYGALFWLFLPLGFLLWSEGRGARRFLMRRRGGTPS